MKNNVKALRRNRVKSMRSIHTNKSKEINATQYEAQRVIRAKEELEKKLKDEVIEDTCLTQRIKSIFSIPYKRVLTRNISEVKTIKITFKYKHTNKINVLY